MNTIKVPATKEYDVMVGTNLLQDIGNYTANVTSVGKAAIVSDSNVWPLYGNIVSNSLRDAGFVVCNYVFPAGESSKNGNTYLSILNFLADSQLTRSDCIIALGGGVTGDMTGFVAATYLRGISYIQVPTSLLAMVDSSVGGKTAIDLLAGKNLAGAFYQPSLVLCDLNVLHTLPDSVFCDGCAEVIKYGVLFDADLFAHLAEYGLSFDRQLVISRCVELKRDVVAADEFEHGMRQLLNLGHTIGHGIEKQSDYSIPHGQAVAAGMAIIARAAAVEGICTRQASAQIRNILEKFSLPTKTVYSARSLFESALSDKKRAADTIHLVIPRRIGHCQIHPTSIQSLEAFIEAGL